MSSPTAFWYDIKVTVHITSVNRHSCYLSSQPHPPHPSNPTLTLTPPSHHKIVHSPHHPLCHICSRAGEYLPSSCPDFNPYKLMRILPETIWSLRYPDEGPRPSGLWSDGQSQWSMLKDLSPPGWSSWQLPGGMELSMRTG